jgi:capsid protein
MGVFDFMKRDKKPVARRSYKAASAGRLFSDFIASSRSADSEIKAALQTLRYRCRDLSRNDEYARRFLTLIKMNVVGERGVQVQVKAKNSDGSFDAPGNRIIENAWATWGRKGICTVDGRYSWKDAQRFAAEALARDGEILVRLVNYSGNPHGFALEFLEVDLLDENHNETLANGNKIRMGVEIDRFHRPVAYHLLTAHPGDNEYTSSLATRRTRVPADKILHIFLPERAQQTRGVPWMAAAIAPLKQLNGMREAVLVNERIAASKMGFFITPRAMSSLAMMWKTVIRRSSRRSLGHSTNCPRASISKPSTPPRARTPSLISSGRSCAASPRAWAFLMPRCRTISRRHPIPRSARARSRIVISTRSCMIS